MAMLNNQMVTPMFIGNQCAKYVVPRTSLDHVTMFPPLRSRPNIDTQNQSFFTYFNGLTFQRLLLFSSNNSQIKLIQICWILVTLYIFL